MKPRILRRPPKLGHAVREQALRAEAQMVLRAFTAGLSPEESARRRKAMAEALLAEMAQAEGPYIAGLKLCVIGARSMNSDWDSKSPRHQVRALAEQVFGERAA